MQFKLMHYQALYFYLFLITCISTLVYCRPSEDAADTYDSEYNGHLSAETISKLQKCDMDMDVMELCMRCAKVTKSQIVYPLCCENEDDVQNWCQRYLFFGQKP